jgi:hypothetical protein
VPGGAFLVRATYDQRRHPLEQHHECECDHSQHQPGANEIACAKGLGAISDHVLRRVYHEDEAEADNELQQHGHANDIDAGRCHALEHGEGAKMTTGNVFRRNPDTKNVFDAEGCEANDLDASEQAFVFSPQSRHRF